LAAGLLGVGVVVPLRAGLWARVGGGGEPPKLDILLVC